MEILVNLDLETRRKKILRGASLGSRGGCDSRWGDVSGPRTKGSHGTGLYGVTGGPLTHFSLIDQWISNYEHPPTSSRDETLVYRKRIRTETQGRTQLLYPFLKELVKTTFISRDFSPNVTRILENKFRQLLELSSSHTIKTVKIKRSSEYHSHTPSLPKSVPCVPTYHNLSVRVPVCDKIPGFGHTRGSQKRRQRRRMRSRDRRCNLQKRPTWYSYST